MNLSSFILREMKVNYTVIKKRQGKEIILVTTNNKDKVFNVAYGLIECNEQITIKATRGHNEN
ncbi:hypothetical protein [Pasteurella multocida]|uniref:hypothetical protein n=1 Tax=Pasteurella multocida TaxID=747 RepID=UPI00397D71BF